MQSSVAAAAAAGTKDNDETRAPAEALTAAGADSAADTRAPQLARSVLALSAKCRVVQWAARFGTGLL